MGHVGVDNGWRTDPNKKRYRCDACGHIFATVTNHWGRIYRGCTNHYYGASAECVEAEEALKDAAKRR